MRVLLTLGFILLLAVSCKTEMPKETGKNYIVNRSETVELIPTEFIDTAYTIEENVWMRDMEKDGELIKKIAINSKCYIMERGSADSIRGVKDYWYKVVCDSKEGWVFGSQLSIKSSRLKAFEQTLAYFLKAYNNKNIQRLNDYVHPQYGISYGYIVCDAPKKKSNDFADVASYPDFISFDTLQEFTESFPDVNCERPYNDELPKYIGNNAWNKNGCYWLEQEKGEVKLVNTETIFEFYFKAIESNWFLVRIEKLDCE